MSQPTIPGATAFTFYVNVSNISTLFVQAFGLTVKLSNGILGLTLLAWGNSVPGISQSVYDRGLVIMLHRLIICPLKPYESVIYNFALQPYIYILNLPFV